MTDRVDPDQTAPEGAVWSCLPCFLRLVCPNTEYLYGNIHANAGTRLWIYRILLYDPSLELSYWVVLMGGGYSVCFYCQRNNKIIWEWSSKPLEALVAQWVKGWPTDLAVPGSTPVWSKNLADGWLVGLGFNGPLRQSISGGLPRRGRKRKERIDESKNVQTIPHPHRLQTQ